MTVTTLRPKAVAPAPPRDPTLEELVTLSLCETGPAAARDVAASLGDRQTSRAGAVLESLAREGAVIRFRAGLNRYYARPRVALTVKGPTVAGLVSDSLRSLVMSCRSIAGARREG